MPEGSSKERLAEFARRTLVIISPGGAAGKGGMASVTNVIVKTLSTRKIFANICVIDSRGLGPAFLWPLSFAASLIRFTLLVLRERVCLLHLQVSERSSFIRKGLMLAVGRSIGLHVILHHHGAEFIPYYQSAPQLLKYWTSWTCRHASLNIVLGDKWKTFLENEIMVEPGRVRVIYNAVPDPIQDKRCEHTVVNKTNEPFQFLLLGHVIARKGIDYFILALQRLRQQGLHVRAIIAGHGDIERYQNMARGCGISDICAFTGWLSQSAAAELLRSSDALVLPSLEEGLPMVILEALSWSIPVISTPVGSIGEVLSSGNDSLLVSPGDELALGDAMLLLAEDPELCRRLGVNGRQLFLRHFTVDAFTDKLLGAYEIACGMRNPV